MQSRMKAIRNVGCKEITAWDSGEGAGWVLVRRTLHKNLKEVREFTSHIGRK